MLEKSFNVTTKHNPSRNEIGKKFLSLIFLTSPFTNTYTKINKQINKYCMVWAYEWEVISMNLVRKASPRV